MSVLPPRPLLATCLVLLGGLAWTVEGRPPPAISPADAPLWEGQAVLVEGWAQDVGQAAGGALRFTVVEGRHAVPARVAGGADILLHSGDRVAVPGRLARGPSGDLQLLVDEPAGVRRIAGQEAVSADGGAIAASPMEWTGVPLRLVGTVEDGGWRVQAHRIRLGLGPWPAAGAIEAEGFLRYDEACLCFVFDAVRLWPWTPSP